VKSPSDQPIYVDSRSVQKRNQHWQLCRRKEIPYITISRLRGYSWILWDLFCIGAAALRLKDEAAQELERYIESLVKQGVVREYSVAGFLKVKREVEHDALTKIWNIVSDSRNWTTVHPSQTDLTWLRNRQARDEASHRASFQGELSQR